MVTVLMGCTRCGLTNRCPVLNKDQCPINLLWEAEFDLARAKMDLVIATQHVDYHNYFAYLN